MKLISKFVIIEGMKLHYLAGGEGRPLLIIPGWLGTAAMYRPSGEMLLHNFKVYIIDIPGQGKSGKLSKDWQFADYQNILNNFIKLLNLQNLILIGHSFGGAIGASVYQDNPNISKLILVNSLGANTPGLFKVWAKSMRQRSFKSEIMIYFPEFIKNVLFPHYLSLKRSLNIIFNLNIEEELKKITKEAIILWGSNDTMLVLEYGRNLAKLIKNSKFITVEGGQHSWLIIFPDRLVNHINYLFSFAEYPEASFKDEGEKQKALENENIINTS